MICLMCSRTVFSIWDCHETKHSRRGRKWQEGFCLRNSVWQDKEANACFLPPLALKRTAHGLIINLHGLFLFPYAFCFITLSTLLPLPSSLTELQPASCAKNAFVGCNLIIIATVNEEGMQSMQDHGSQCVKVWAVTPLCISTATCA